jgi:hypothetical protein
MPISIEFANNLIVVLTLASMLVGFFLHINKIENQILTKFFRFERMLKLILLGLEIEQSRISDYETFLEKKLNFPKRNFPKINYTDEELK